MPIYRYRSFEQAQMALWRFDTDAGYYRMLADLFHLGCHLSPPAHPAGIFRFHSLEEANAHRTSWYPKPSCRRKPVSSTIDHEEKVAEGE